MVVTQKPAGKIIRGIEMGQEDLLKVRLTQITSCIAMLLRHRYVISAVFIPEKFILFIE